MPLYVTPTLGPDGFQPRNLVFPGFPAHDGGDHTVTASYDGQPLGPLTRWVGVRGHLDYTPVTRAYELELPDAVACATVAAWGTCNGARGALRRWAADMITGPRVLVYGGPVRVGLEHVRRLCKHGLTERVRFLEGGSEADGAHLIPAADAVEEYGRRYRGCGHIWAVTLTLVGGRTLEIDYIGSMHHLSLDGDLNTDRAAVSFGPVQAHAPLSCVPVAVPRRCDTAPTTLVWLRMTDDTDPIWLGFAGSRHVATVWRDRFGKAHARALLPRTMGGAEQCHVFEDPDGDAMSLGLAWCGHVVGGGDPVRWAGRPLPIATLTEAPVPTPADALSALDLLRRFVASELRRDGVGGMYRAALDAADVALVALRRFW